MLFANLKTCLTLVTTALVVAGAITGVAAVHTASSSVCLADSDGVCQATATLLLDLDTMSLTTSFTTPTAAVPDVLYAHIHMGARGVDGDVMTTLCADAAACLATAGVETTTVLTNAQFHMLVSDALYINIHSTSLPAGALRGQLTMGDNAFVTPLSDAANVATTGTTATATFSAFYDTTTGWLWWSLTHNVDGVSAAHLHNAVAGATGSATHTLCADAATCTLTDGYVVGVATMTAAHGWMLANNAMYVNVHSTTYPAGAVRGQLLLGGQRFVTTLTAAQETGSGDTSKSGAAAAFMDEWRNKLTYSASHDVADATGAHFHGPAAMGVDAGVLADVSASLTQGVVLTAAVTPSSALKMALYADDLYYNIHSPAFAAGAIRGQWWADTVSTGTVALTAASNVVATDETGVGAFAGVFDPATMMLTWALTHNVVGADAIHLHAGAVGATGSALHVLAANAAQSTTTLSGVTTMTQTSAMALLSGGMYVNLHSATYAAGAIRGDVHWRNVIGMKTTATLTGAAEVDSVGDSASSGAAWSVFNPHSKKLVTILSHTASTATAAHVHGPATTTTNGGVLATIASSGESPMASVSVLTTAGSAAYIAGMTYVNVHTPAFAAGAVRGQNVPTANAFTSVLSASLDATAGDTSKSGTFYAVFDAVRGEFFWTLTHTVTDATAVHLHNAMPGATGDVLYAVASDAATAATAQTVGWLTLSSTAAYALVSGSVYLNIHSAAFPASALRGDLMLSGTKMMTTLTAAAEVDTVGDSTQSGMFYCFYDATTMRLTTALSHTIADADVTGAHIHGPATATTNGGVLHALSSATSMSVEAVWMTTASAAALTSSMTYVNVHSTTFAAGAIRGHLTVAGATSPPVTEENMPPVTRMQADPNPPTTAATHSSTLASAAAWTVMIPGATRVTPCTYGNDNASNGGCAAQAVMLDCARWSGVSADAIVVKMTMGIYSDYVKPAVGGSLCSLLDTRVSQPFRVSSSPEGPWTTSAGDDARMLGGGMTTSALQQQRQGIVGPYWGAVVDGMPTGGCGHATLGDDFQCGLDLLISVSVVGDWAPYMWTSGTHFLTSTTYTEGYVGNAGNAAGAVVPNYVRRCGDFDAAGATGLFVRVTMGTYVDYFKPTTSLCVMLTQVGQWYWHSMTAPSAMTQTWGGVVGNHGSLLGGWATYGADTRTWGSFWGAPSVNGYYAEAGGCCENAVGAPIQFWRAFSMDVMLV